MPVKSCVRACVKTTTGTKRKMLKSVETWSGSSCLFYSGANLHFHHQLTHLLSLKPEVGAHEGPALPETEVATFKIAQEQGIESFMHPSLTSPSTVQSIACSDVKHAATGL